MLSRTSCVAALAAASVVLPAAPAVGSTVVTLNDAETVYTVTGSVGVDDIGITSAPGFDPDPGDFIFTDDDNDATDDDVTALGPLAQAACTPNSADRIACDAGGIVRIDVRLFSGDDELAALFSFGPSAPLDIEGGPDDDTITAARAADTIDGDSGIDSIDGGGGGDTITGGSDHDTLTGGTGEDRLTGGTGNDTLSGGDGSDPQLAGDDGNDTISGGDGEDSITGGANNDTITAGPENDAVDGGTGAGDRIRYDEPNRGGGVTVTLADGSTGSDGGALETSESAVNFERVTGTASSDQIAGDPSANILDGGGGDDRLAGLAGGDTLNGGAGADTLDGGAGGDTLDGGADRDTADYSARADKLAISIGTGTGDDGGEQDGLAGARDTVAAIETLLGGSADDVLGTAEGAPVTLRGNGGDDSLTGGAAADALAGGTGADLLDGAGGDDTALYDEPERSEGVVVTLSAGNADDGSAQDAGAGGLRDTVAGTEHLVGTAFADRLVGDSGGNALAGGGGDDVLAGGPGADVLGGGDGSDTASYAERGADQPVTVILDGSPAGAPGEGDAIGADVENAAGGAGADVLIGSDGGNVLDGGDGRDTLTGLGGVDAFFAGAGDDDVRAVDGNAEPIDCGAGTDSAAADAADQVAGCELLAIANLLVDADGDGFAAGAGGDCDDANPAINPGARERPGNAVDEDCAGGAAPFTVIGASIVSFFRVGGGRTTVTELTVKRLPAGSRVVLKCKPPKGKRRACPFRRIARSFAARRRKLALVKSFEGRALPRKTTIELRVTDADVLGKLLRWKTRRGDRAPRKLSRCLVPGSRRPARCP